MPELPRMPPPPPAEALPPSEREYPPALRLDGLPVGVGVMVPPADPDTLAGLRLLDVSYVDMVEAVNAGGRLPLIEEE